MRRACDDRLARRLFRKLVEQPEISLFSDGSGPRRQVLTFQARREGGGLAEKAARLLGRKPGEPSRFEVGGGLVGRLDDPDHIARQRRRQAEAQMNGGKEALLDSLVGVA